jgi:hypothetical protein
MNSDIVHPSHIAISSRLTEWAADAEARRDWLAECLLRPNSGDWGELDDEDLAANNHALRRIEGRVLSAYQVPVWLAVAAVDPTVWVITDDLEDDEHTTTMLWPSDY